MTKDKTEYMRQWCERNREAVAAKNRRYYAKNRERIIRQAQEYYRRTHIPRDQMTEEQKAEARAFEALYREANREKIRAYHRRLYHEVIKPRREGRI